MPIPPNITREHILAAMLKIHRESVPPGRGAREWAVLYEGVQYPCKLLISWGNIYANGEDLNPNPNIFNTYDAQDFLSNLNFQIIAI